jgi:hypothetical protein
MAINKDLLELATFKCLCEAPLTVKEALQVAEATVQDLFEAGLKSKEIELVRSWFRSESQRLISQSMLDKSMIAESSKGTISNQRLREIIAEEVIAFEGKKH